MLASCAAFVLSAELMARLDDYVRRGVPWSSAPDLTRDLILRDSLGPRGKPNGHYQRFKLNSAGFRSSEGSLTVAQGCTRVMTLGSSETFGAGGESPGQEYPAQLGDSLARHGCFQVLNAAIIGIALPGMTEQWNNWAWRFRPDIVVVLANPMFYLGNEPPTYPLPETVRPATSPWWHPRILDRAHEVIHYPDFIQRRRVRRALDALTAGHPTEWFFSVPPRDRLERYRRDLDSLVVAIRSRAAVPVLAAYPMRFGAKFNAADSALLIAWRQYTPRALPFAMLAFETAAADIVRDVGRAREVRVVDLPSTITGHRDWFVDFVHYTDTGAGAVAGRVAEVLVGPASPPDSSTRPSGTRRAPLPPEKGRSR